ncbi:ATP-binding protein [Massilia sp. R2A-15]|uniref:ATP-binding protein n=1 Tax=Massilia sp. R2A-15 TaxID=3064278 RepID=UPI00273263D0|nr:ATP-binding protein [Massilia sp. R2A-15]WLI87569.1 ATP-binding protein [Massilia sp. R2A-15]
MIQAPPAPSPFDLSSCDKEPIRFPGSIQPHGFLLCLSPARRIVQASDNLAAHAGVAATAAIGGTLEAVIGAAAAEMLLAELDQDRLGERPAYLATVQLPNDSWFDVLGHAFDGLVLLEFETIARTAAATFRDLFPLVGEFMQQLPAAPSVEAMSQTAARQIRKLTGFGRVMVYQFDRDGHGHVIAESRDADHPSYLGQRFPGTDIPRQARELYTINRIRLIQDANYTPSRLVPETNPLTGKPNDLSFAALRSVSPIHLQYMRNMDTLASMSVSIIVKGQLWGLISCHHAAPRPLEFDKRSACEQLGQVLSLCIESREDADDLQFRLDLRRIMVSMLAGLTHGADFIDNMSQVFPELLRFARAGGAAIVVDDRLIRFGNAPDEAQIRALVDWLGVNSHDDLFHTDHLSAAYPPAAEYVSNASGLLAMPISRIHKHYLLWFRPEVVHTIDWAGNPHEKDGAQNLRAQLTPRTSFASWRETIHGTSVPWRSGELELAIEFRSALLGIALERAEQMAELADELGRANKELEAFSYSVSHDLRAPLRHIVGFSNLLMESDSDPQTRQRFLANIKDSARLAGKLVDDLLSFSQMGRAALRPVAVDMADLVQGCIDKLAGEVGERKVEWRIGELPVIQADPTFLQLAVYNLLANAVKFTGQQELAIISVDASVMDTQTVFRVADNGAGFNMDYVHKLFGVFQRLHRMEDFQGTGIGLANVRRIVERHGGRVWAESAPGEGATFYFSIPNELDS